MKYCSKCGSENPDDGSFCWKCGAELYSGGTGSFLPDHGKVAEQTVPNPVETKVEASRTVQEVDYVDADGRTVLAKTPERILNRRVCLFLSVVTAIAILVATFGFQVNITESVGGFVIDHDEESFMDIAEMSPYGIGIYAFLALTVVFALLTFVSPRFALPAIVTFVITFVLSYIPFTVTNRLVSIHYDPSGTTNIVMLVVVVVIFVILEVLAEISLGRSVNKDGKAAEKDTVVKNHGLTYNIDPTWNIVTRK